MLSETNGVGLPVVLRECIQGSIQRNVCRVFLSLIRYQSMLVGSIKVMLLQIEQCNNASCVITHVAGKWKFTIYIYTIYDRIG